MLVGWELFFLSCESQRQDRSWVLMNDYILRTQPSSTRLWNNYFTCFYSSDPSRKLSFQKWLLNHSNIQSRPALVSEGFAEFIKGWSRRRSGTWVSLCSPRHKDILEYEIKKAKKKLAGKRWEDKTPQTPAVHPQPCYTTAWCIFNLTSVHILCFCRPMKVVCAVALHTTLHMDQPIRSQGPWSHAF